MYFVFNVCFKYFSQHALFRKAYDLGGYFVHIDVFQPFVFAAKLDKCRYRIRLKRDLYKLIPLNHTLFFRSTGG